MVKVAVFAAARDVSTTVIMGPVTVEAMLIVRVLVACAKTAVLVTGTTKVLTLVVVEREAVEDLVTVLHGFLTVVVVVTSL
jgi:hypothetical protein